MHRQTAPKFACGFALILGVLTGTPAKAQQTLDLTIAQSRVVAVRAMQTRRPAVAKAIALGLLQRDPNDIEALLLLSAAQTALGDGKEAVASGKRALALAQSPLDKFAAFRMIASGKAQQKKFNQAGFWLRRALQIAPDAQYQNVVKTDFRRIKRQNPLQLSFTFGISPTSNINNGAASDRAWLWGLPFSLSPDAQALSGVKYAAGFKARYRLHQTATRATDIGFLTYGTAYSLSSASKTSAPLASASDYSFATTELSLTHSTLHNQGKALMTYTSALGQNWYGGAPLSRFARLGVERKQTVSRRLYYKLGATVDHQNPFAAGANNTVTVALNTTLGLKSDKGRQFTFGLERRQSFSDSQSSEFTSMQATATYAPAKGILGMDFSFNLGVENRDYASSVFDQSGRHDTRLSAGVSMVFTKADMFGFSPTLDIKASKNTSNIDLYSTESLSANIGFRSTF